MAAEPGLDADGFGTLFRDFLQRVVEAAPLQEAPFAAILRQHLRQDPTTLPIVSRGFPAHDHPNIQLALDAWLAPKARQAELVGVTGQGKRFAGLSLSDLLGAHPLGMILFELLVDAPPFDFKIMRDAGDLELVYDAVRNADPPPPSRRILAIAARPGPR